MKILVTGASGFIGGRFARFALEQGLDVRVNGRRPEGVEHLVKRGAEFVQGDLSDTDLVLRLCDDVEAVVHCAGAVGVWGKYEHFHQANVQVTENVVEACLKQRVKRLVHLSSPSIYFDGRSHVGIREEQVPKRFSDHYGATKYLAEQKVFAAEEFGLEVIAFRPRFVTGAGDTSIFPRLIAMQRKGRLKIIGNGLNKVDFTSVQNLNDALLSGLLAAGPALGQVYNISNGQPVPIWDVINYVLRKLGVPQVTRHVPYGLAYSAALVNESVCRILPGRPEPSLYRLAVAVMAKDFSLDISRARQYLDYDPRVNVWTALDEFCAWWGAQQP
ncbi:NAD-dependent epimerase/dehydratase family protein [Pseudomonas sp. JS3066]|jgi:nucleoside-diphosphate-sugar epimerase|uniref:NAD-dependent epimerase/dehydratase family protein n=1 Tax=unclassified Pseudomonas TaxID=196821 RepID=UPI000EAA0EF6|nr:MULTISPECIES: NAD-dependent epimerase/dehydratase family protein [unclassified Pseudomonas]AYF90287.1 NAD-dependent epimerase/dehydratase family protein [Pseudomonas sp. DY-1]MDH4652530.1 NAD-dependent epimerase/dehydratase family protein [Pseudomonas sp. BN606]MRK20861.1 NAD-dependent epimerase/dehydratase family protein [Pseudomonas sp. JG-B]WVK92140.1 NAD-dependent epimerase/dehydratase family protein [Pseudomonas sp. JS3066]